MNKFKSLNLSLLLLIGFLFSCGTETKPSYTITTSASPGGAGEISIFPSVINHDEGSKITFQAVPAKGYSFTEWQGDVSGFSNPTTLTISKNISVIAVFEKSFYPLVIDIEGEGSVKEDVIQAKSDYEHGTVVQLSAIPEVDWEFTGWRGDFISTEAVVQVPIEKEMNITAVFKSKTNAVYSRVHTLDTYKAKTFTVSAKSPRGLAITYSLGSDPSHGEAIVIGDEVTYTPEDGYEGVDTFYVTASDCCSSTQIKIEVDVFHNPYIDHEFKNVTKRPLGPEVKELFGEPKNQLRYQVTYRDVLRNFVVVQPNTISDFNLNEHPVVITLHGNGGGIFSGYRREWVNNAQELNFYYVIAEGKDSPIGDGTIMTGWNANFPGWNNDYDDSGFIKALVNYLLEEYSISEDKIYLKGFSSGAHFAYVAANDNILIDGMQVHGGWMNKFNEWVFEQPLKAQHFHALGDYVGYYEGEGHFGGESSIKHIASLKQCESSQQSIPDRNSDGKRSGMLFKYTNCNDGSKLEHYRMEGDHHTFIWEISAHDVSSLEEFFRFFELGEPVY